MSALGLESDLERGESKYLKLFGLFCSLVTVCISI